jgi:hypothetical protein
VTVRQKSYPHDIFHAAVYKTTLEKKKRKKKKKEEKKERKKEKTFVRTQ